MGVAGDEATLSESWQARIFTDSMEMSEPQRGICEISNDSISIRAGRQSQTIEFNDIRDITVGDPPDSFTDEFDEVFGIKFKPSTKPRICLIEYDPDRVDIFEHRLFAEMINGANGVIELGAMKGGQQRDVSSKQIQVAIKPDGVVFKLQSGSTTEIALGDIVNIQTGSRTVGEAKQNVIKLDHMKDKTRVTSYVSIVETRIQHLLNRYMRKEYAQLREEISETEISQTETQLIVGYYTTQDIDQTMQTLTGGDKYKFESIYEKALDHGLVTHPDDGVGLTQKGRMLANTEIETVNA